MSEQALFLIDYIATVFLRRQNRARLDSSKMLEFLGLLLCLGVALHLTVAKSNLCKDLEQQCTYKGPVLAMERAGSFISEEFLENHCGDVADFIKCQKNYLSVCSKESYKPFVELTKGAAELMDELCNETSEMRAGYRQHVPCFRNSSSLFVSCTLNSIKEMAGYMVFEGEDTNDILMGRLCRFYDLFQACTQSEVEQKCGVEGARYLKVLLEKPVAHIRAEKCNTVSK